MFSILAFPHTASLYTKGGRQEPVGRKEKWNSEMNTIPEFHFTRFI